MHDVYDVIQDGRGVNLIAAVVHNALIDHQHNLKKLGEEPAMREEPAQWIMSDDNRAYGYVWCCDVLNLAPDRLRMVMNNKNLIKDMRKYVSKAGET